jgi:hypothetical protein
MASHNGVTYSSFITRKCYRVLTQPSEHIGTHILARVSKCRHGQVRLLHQPPFTKSRYHFLVFICNLPHWDKCIAVPRDWVLTIMTLQCSKWAARNVVITSDSVFVNCGADFAKCSYVEGFKSQFIGPRFPSLYLVVRMDVYLRNVQTKIIIVFFVFF